MLEIKQHRDLIALGAGAALPAGVAAVVVPFRASLASAASALVLVVVIVGVAVIGNRLAGIVASLSAAVWFDFFLTRPYERLTITHRPDIETAVSIFLVGVAVTELAARNRLNSRAASEESDYVGLIYYLSELVADGTPVDKIIQQANAELVELLHLRASRFELGAVDQHLTQIEHDGHVDLGFLRWGVHQMGLPGKELELLVEGRGILLGRFVIEPTPGSPVSIQRRVVAVAIADQVGAAITPHVRSA